MPEIFDAHLTLLGDEREYFVAQRRVVGGVDVERQLVGMSRVSEPLTADDINFP
jgi:hypothetical protein